MKPTAAAERDFFQRLLVLYDTVQLDEALARALEALVAVTGAMSARVELTSYSPGRPFSAAYPHNHAMGLPAPVLKAVVARASSEQRTLRVGSLPSDAKLRRRLSSRSDVADLAVLCGPLVTWCARGALVLVRSPPGPFSERHREDFELMRRVIAEISDRLILRRPYTHGGLADHVRRFQQHHVEEALATARWNVDTAARSLGVTRTFVDKVIRSAGLKRPKTRRGGS